MKASVSKREAQDLSQDAEGAGHSVNVLLRVYAKCIVGQEDEARRRITEAPGEDLS